MNILKRNLLFALSLTLVFSCGGKSKSENSLDQASSYKLEIVDSVQADILGSGLSLLDVHSETGDLLVIQPNPPKLWVLSQEGEVKQTWSKTGDGPDEIGSVLLSAEFFGEGIAMMGRMVVKIFDHDFKAKGSFRPGFSPSSIGYTGFNHLQEFKEEGSSQLITFFGKPQTNEHWDTPDYYYEYNTVDKLDPSKPLKGNFKPLGKLEKDSRFIVSGRSYYYIKPTFDIKGNSLIYAYNWDTVLYKRSLPNGELISSTPIPFDEFYLDKGWTMGKARQEMNSGNVAAKDRSGSVDRVFQVDGFDVVFYSSGLSLERRNAIALEGVAKAREEFRLDFSKHLILKEGERLNKGLRTTDKIIAPSLADDNGFIWALQNVSALDSEPDLITFYKLKIVPDEN